MEERKLDSVDKILAAHRDVERAVQEGRGRLRALRGIIVRWKIGRIEHAIERLMQATGIKSSVMWYGAYWINPRFLAYWIIVDTDKDKLRLQSDKALMDGFRDLLRRYRYPEAAREFVAFGIESRETVNRDWKGDWYARFH